MSSPHSILILIATGSKKVISGDQKTYIGENHRLANIGHHQQLSGALYRPGGKYPSRSDDEHNGFFRLLPFRKGRG